MVTRFLIAISIGPLNGKPISNLQLELKYAKKKVI